MSYQIYSDATADACPSMLEGLPAAEIIPMEVMVGDQSYTYGPGGDLTVERFYAEQRAGKFATTSQINPLVYRKAFEKALKNGQDVLYLCFSSGLSGTIERARLCMRELAEEYPERKLVCVDSLCASVGGNMPMVLSAVISGAAFGAHACFYCDVTIFTSGMTKIDNMEHATTQLPYCLIGAGVTTLLYLVAGFLF